MFSSIDSKSINFLLFNLIDEKEALVGDNGFVPFAVCWRWSLVAWVTSLGHREFDTLKQMANVFIFLHENHNTLIQIPLYFVSYGPIENLTRYLCVKSWCQTGDNPSSKPMLLILHDTIWHQFSDRHLPFSHDDVIKWKHFPRYWPFVRGIHRSPVNSPCKGQWRGALMFSLICVWINGWVNNRETRDLRRYRAHYDVIVMNDTW